MSRRSVFITMLCCALLVPSAAGAAEPESEGGKKQMAGAKQRTERAFKSGDWKLKKVGWKKLRFNGGNPLPVETIGPQDDKGMPMRPLGPDGELVYNPTVLAQQGMKRLDTYVQTGKKVHLRQARKYADLLKKISEGGKKRRWQPHWYDISVHDKGWVNANSHGLVLSFLSRYYKLTDARKRLKEADLLMAAFEQRPRNQRWFSSITGAGYVWFEHWPDGRNDRTLNAHINALFGLYDYWRVTKSPLAKKYFLGGVKTVRDKLYRFRRKGELSRYSLAGTAGTLHYHETHIEQLRTLAKMTGDKWFERQADRFEQDEITWRARHRGAGR